MSPSEIPLRQTTPDSTNTSTSGSDSDDQLDPQFVIRSQKSQMKARKKKEKARKHSSKVVRLSSHSELPHHASALSRSIIDFTKGMLGCSAHSSKLPSPPSTEELQGWENWSSNRQAAMNAAIEAQSHKSHVNNESERRMMIRNHSNDLKLAIGPINYNPAPSINSQIPGTFQTACHDDFKSEGFPRITFDWKKPKLNNSDWNSATANILALNWNKYYLHDRKSPKQLNGKVNATGIIERWLTTMKKKYAKEVVQAEENDENQQMENANLRRYKQKRKRIAEIRFKTAISVFPEKPDLCVIFKDIDVVSDYEDSENIHEAQISITPSWRSKSLNCLIAELDTAAIQLAKPRNRPSVHMLLARQYSRNPTEEEEEWQPIPEKLPFEAYNDNFLADKAPLQLRQMGIREKQSTDCFLAAFLKLKQLTTPASSSKSTAMET